ncbi:MAG TPA: endopeptidase La [Blastocatellia bacterium]
MERAEVLPVLPLKNTVLLPFTTMPLLAGRPASVAAVEAALATESKELAIVTQRDATKDNPTAEDFYAFGAKAVIRKMARGSEGEIQLIVQGVERVRIARFEQTAPYIKASVHLAPMPEEKGPELEALYRSVLELASKALVIVQPDVQVDIAKSLPPAEDLVQHAYLIASMLGLDVIKEQTLLEAPTRIEALRLLHSYLASEIQVLEIRRHIASKMETEMTRQQREYLLRQQLAAIQEELGDKSPEQSEAALLRRRLADADLPEEARQEAGRELSRMEKLPSSAPDYHVIRAYLDLILELPWRKSTEAELDLARARRTLDEDHFDLKEVKERILEHLGVLKLNPSAKAPILCLVGPPGVGKTSLGQSIARAMGRKFERLSLGGLHDESELRGHRRTYIGAMPGRIIQSVRRAAVNNPLLMLDEVDKLGRDFHGDPAAALLEILDPEQNKTFRDNYLDLPFDLSKVFFITTANTLETIPRPLLDRMELLRLSGYSDEEKIMIARRYLIPRQLKEAGLTEEQLTVTDEALRRVISHYTREAGLRQLERAIGRLARKIALRFAEGKMEVVKIEPSDLAEMLGPEKFYPEQARKQLPPGVATGLAWTEAGGDVLYVEATLLPEGRSLTITGQLGEVMQESAKAAQSYIWSHANELGVDRSLFKESGVHIHVPAGAIPKDGPSAGVTMATALVSLYAKTPARSDTAMTGEITLTGLVLPIGGVKEKVLAARRAGLRRMILPKENEKDLRELPDNIRAEMEFIFVERVEQALIAAIPELDGRLTVAQAATLI